MSQQLTFRKNRWIDGWNPEDEEQWGKVGQKIANRNLGFSIYAEFLGFVVWQLWSIVVVSLGKYGFAFDDGQQFWLISLPSLVGATLRFPYTFMVSKIGGRNWTIVSAALLLIPTIAMTFAIGNHPVDGQGGTSYAVMLLVAALGGFGGGNFASSMANITFFFPQRSKGWALGLNAAGGNIGASVSQFAVPILVSVTAAADVPNLPIAGWIWIPFIIVAVLGAVFFMNNLTSAKTDYKAYVAALKDPQLWLMSLLYIGTFGSFIGLSGAFPKLIADQFTAYSTFAVGAASLSLAFLGPLVGSLARPYGGRLADRFGGAIITVIAFVVMAAGTVAVIGALSVETPSFWAFLACFLVVFVATGVGNGSMYRMIPTVFAFAAGQTDAQHRSAGISTERKTSAALGIVSACGAYGGFLMPQLFNATLKQTADHPVASQVV
ncbi:MAG: NarK/NasA family nitrate transporter, partial [Propionibacteriaceae bacterium]|nr:NarK/NasA family nitrate transporter [Propionibacteriaceae bacterium]